MRVMRWLDVRWQGEVHLPHSEPVQTSYTRSLWMRAMEKSIFPTARAVLFVYSRVQTSLLL